MEKIIAANQLKTPSDNALGIKNPNDYSCYIIRYSHGHSIMYVQLNHLKEENKNYVVIFETVAYFQGFTSWQGANFCVLSMSEYVELMTDLDPNEINLEEQARYWDRIFEVQTERGRIRIVARMITIRSGNHWEINKQQQ